MWLFFVAEIIKNLTEVVKNGLLHAPPAYGIK